MAANHKACNDAFPCEKDIDRGWNNCWVSGPRLRSAQPGMMFAIGAPSMRSVGFMKRSSAMDVVTGKPFIGDMSCAKHGRFAGKYDGGGEST